MSFSQINGLSVVVPMEFEGIVPVSPSTDDFRFEMEAFRGLRACVRPGDTVIDAGASYGVMTVLMAMLAGPQGRVLSIEPNQEAQQLGRMLAASNPQIATVQFLNALAGERAGVADFWVVPGLQSVASTRNGDIRSFHRDCRREVVPMITLDDLRLEAVSTIKLDVEGGEYAALLGAAGLLKRLKPRLVIETHGQEIDGICGNLKQLCVLLTDLGYQLWDLTAGQPTAPGAFATAYETRIGQLLATPSLQDIPMEQLLDGK